VIQIPEQGLLLIKAPQEAFDLLVPLMLMGLKKQCVVYHEVENLRKHSPTLFMEELVIICTSGGEAVQLVKKFNQISPYSTYVLISSVIKDADNPNVTFPDDMELVIQHVCKQTKAPFRKTLVRQFKKITQAFSVEDACQTLITATMMSNPVDYQKRLLMEQGSIFRLFESFTSKQRFVEEFIDSFEKATAKTQVINSLLTFLEKVLYFKHNNSHIKDYSQVYKTLLESVAQKFEERELIQMTYVLADADGPDCLLKIYSGLTGAFK